VTPFAHAAHWASIAAAVTPVVVLGVWLLVLRRRGERPGREP
jgi:hypothetical protein